MPTSGGNFGTRPINATVKKPRVNPARVGSITITRDVVRARQTFSPPAQLPVLPQMRVNPARKPAKNKAAK